MILVILSKFRGASFFFPLIFLIILVIFSELCYDAAICKSKKHLFEEDKT